MHTGCIPIVISKCFANSVSLYTHDKVRAKCMLTYPADCDCWNMLGGRYPWPSSLAFTSSSPFGRKLNWGMPRLLYHLAFVQCSLLECLFSIQLVLGYLTQINPTSLQIYNGSCSMWPFRSTNLQFLSSAWSSQAWFGLATLPGPTMHPNGSRTRSTKARMFLDHLGPYSANFRKSDSKSFRYVQLVSTAASCRLLFVAVLLATYWPSTHNRNCRFFDSDEMLLWLHRISLPVLQHLEPKLDKLGKRANKKWAARSKSQSHTFNNCRDSNSTQSWDSACKLICKLTCSEMLCAPQNVPQPDARLRWLHMAIHGYLSWLTETKHEHASHASTVHIASTWYIGMPLPN